MPPSKPDSISIVHTPADTLLTSDRHMEYSTSFLSSTLTSEENDTILEWQTVEQKDKPEYYRVKTDGYDTTTSTSSEVDFSILGIVEGDNITVICAGDVGKPSSEHIFQKYRNGTILSMNFTATETFISEISGYCSYYRTSKITFQLKAEDNNAVIRCVVNSSMVEPDMYIETAPIEVFCKYILCNLVRDNSFLCRFCIT